MNNMEHNVLSIVELFSGPGGLGLGFHLQGFKSVVAYEYEDDCIETYSANFPDTEVIKKDLAEFTEDDIVQLKKIVREKTGREDVDVVMGGPPCRSFSSANPKKKVGDPRDFLFRSLIKVAAELNAKYFVMENVADLSNKATEGKHERKIFHVILNELYEKGFKYINCNILKASDYGTPQTRERLIILATKNKDLPLSFPNPIFFQDKEPRWKTVQEAFQDLPRVTAPQDEIVGKDQEKVMHKDTIGYYCEEYGDQPKNDFTNFCRGLSQSYGYANELPIRDVEILGNFVLPNHTKRIIHRYSLLREDESQGKLRDRLEEELSLQEFNELLEKKIISTGTFRQKNRRIPYSKPARTVTSHVREEFVHPLYNRNLTAREAARLQGFPDWYIIKGKNQKPYKATDADIGNGRDIYQQIGDAVPPLLATALANEIKRNLLSKPLKIDTSEQRKACVQWIIQNEISILEIIRDKVFEKYTMSDLLTGNISFAEDGYYKNKNGQLTLL